MIMPNDWNRIRAFYREAEPDILAAGSWEWGIDAYLWDNGMLEMTPIEAWLWHDIRNNNAVLYPQYPVGPFFVDFGNPVAKVAVECDGAEFHKDYRKDERRDAHLRELGWSVYRAPGWLCRTDSDPETGEPGKAHRFIEHICQVHKISRNDRPAPSGDEWMPMAESVSRELQRQREILAAGKTFHWPI